jgi:hypothetical protein
MDDERVDATISALRSECEICGAWAAFTGATEVHDGLTYAIFRCPNEDGEFLVWNRDHAPLLAAYVRGRADGSGYGARIMNDPQLLRSIAERLCGVQSGAEAEIRAFFGMPADPPPLGAREVEIHGDVLSLACLELRWSPPVFTKAELDGVFGGVGQALPRTGAGASHVFGYPVAVSGAPSRVTVFASFADKPNAETGAKNVLFRIDPP